MLAKWMNQTPEQLAGLIDYTNYQEYEKDYYEQTKGIQSYRNKPVEPPKTFTYQKSSYLEDLDRAKEKLMEGRKKTIMRIFRKLMK